LGSAHDLNFAGDFGQDLQQHVCQDWVKFRLSDATQIKNRPKNPFFTNWRKLVILVRKYQRKSLL